MTRGDVGDFVDLTLDSDDGMGSAAYQAPVPRKTPVPLPANVAPSSLSTPGSTLKKTATPPLASATHKKPHATLPKSSAKRITSKPPSTSTSVPRRTPVPLPDNVRSKTCTPTPQFTKSHVPLPGSARHTPQPPLTSGFANHTRIHTSTTPSTSSSRPSAACSSASMGHNTASKSYVPISSSNQKRLDSLNDTEQAAKRRKLLAHGMEANKGAAQALVNGTAADGQPTNNGLRHNMMSDKTKVTSNSDSILSAKAKAASTYKPPSVQHMNAALKANRTAMSVVNNTLDDNPRPLNIGRVSEADVANDLLTPNATTSATALISSSGADSFVKTTSMASKLIIHNQKQSNVVPRTEITQKTVASPLVRHVAASTPIPLVQDDDDDANSFISYSSDPFPPLAESPAPIQTEDQPTPVSNVKAPGQTLERSKQFSQEEDHFLIFLKEVKRYSWARITDEFNLDYPGRTYATLQTTYSSRLNRRDRSRDPPVLNLPPRFTTGASIDWQTVHAESSGPRERSDLMTLHQDANALSQRTQRPGRLTGRLSLAHTTTDYSSGTDSAPRRERTRRAPTVNYTWPRQRGTRLDDEMDISDEDQSIAWNSSMRSETSGEFLQMAGKDIAVDNEPIDMDFDANDAAVALATRKGSRDASSRNLPYLTSTQRSIMHDTPASYTWDQFSSRDWQGLAVHVDFSPAEIDMVTRAIVKVSSPNDRHSSRHSTQRRHLRTLLKSVTEPKLLRITNEVRRYLSSRDRASIAAFLQDAMMGKISDSPKVQRLAAAKPDKNMNSDQKLSTSTIIRQRELGLQSRRGWKTASKPLTYQTKNKYMDTLGPSHTWTGAAGDTHTVAWSPDGQCFVAGAVAVTDPDSMQYNRPNNLLYGDISRGTIHELGEHIVDRPRTKTGANSTHAMFVSQDPRLYTTVSSVGFSRSGKLMYSAGYDKNVCVWDITADASQPDFVSAWKHKAEIDIIAVNPQYDGKLATAAKRSSENAIKLISVENEDDPSQFTKTNYYSAKAASRSDLRILPTALQFEPRYGRLLLAGFGANVRQDHGLDTTGDICLWDVETQAQMNIHGSSKNIFDVAFNPNQRYMPFFAYGCVATGNVNKGTRSLIRLYERATPNKYGCPLEMECKALDMNDVVWCPYDEYLIAAGCTDGKAYVWDMRMPNDPLRVLSHGQSKMPLQDDLHPEHTDTGVRFLSWGENATRLYSGSSDGVVKVWDVTRSEENTFVKDLITIDSGIMAGSFSPDMSKLIIGEVNGSISVLEVGRAGCSIKDAEKLQYISYADNDIDDEVFITGEPAFTESSIADANHLLQTEQMQLVPMGGLPIRQAVQGPNYGGPFDQSVDAPFLREQALNFQLSLPSKLDPPCSVPGCEGSINKTTNEEVGDSKRSADRIPDELRRQWKALDSNLIIPGKSRCTHCTRPARPSSSNPDAPTLCERCSFECFRCGAVNSVASVTTTLICDSCAGIWEIGVLGYDCIQQPLSTGEPLDVPRLKKFGKESYLQRLEDVDTTFGDEMNALTEYYYSLAIDRPESPPL